MFGFSADQTTGEKLLTGFPVSRCLAGEFHDEQIEIHSGWHFKQRNAIFILDASLEN